MIFDHVLGRLPGRFPFAETVSAPCAEQVLRAKRGGQTVDPASGTGHGDHRGVDGASIVASEVAAAIHLLPADVVP